MNYINDNKNSYDKEYSNGWGNQYPNTLMISYYYNKIVPLLSESPKIGGGGYKKKVLEFGCGLGSNLAFLNNIGYEVYGVDISKAAIDKCISINGFERDHFKAVNILESGNYLNEIFEVKFDIIIASAVMYYLSNDDIKKVVEQFFEVCNPKGILYVTMITFNNDTYREYSEDMKNNEGLILVNNTGSVNEKLYVNIMNDDEQLCELLAKFKSKHVLHSIIEMDGYNESIHFIGQKE